MSQPTFPGGIDLLPGPQGPPIPANALRIVTIGGAPFSTTDGITFIALGGSGGGVSDGVTITGVGSVGNPFAGIPSTPTNAGTMSAADKQYINVRDWDRAMFAFAQKQYPTINRQFIIPFSQGAAGDYQTGLLNAPATATMSTTIAQDILLDSNSGANAEVAVVGKNNPIIIGAVTTQPWMVASRCKLDTAISAGSDARLICPTTGTSPFTLARPIFGAIGAGSTSFFTFQVAAGVNLVTSVPLDTTSFNDFAIGYDGSTTLTAYFGDVVAGTLAVAASSTNLTGLTAGTGQPGILLFTSDTVRVQFDCTRLGAWTKQP